MIFAKDARKKRKKNYIDPFFYLQSLKAFYPRVGYRKPALFMSSKWATIFAGQGGYSGRM